MPTKTDCARSLPPDGPEGDAIRRAPPVRLIFKKELLQRVGLSFPTIWKMMREDRFPRARIIGGKSAWLENEIDGFLTELPLRRYKRGAVEN
jgi:predicted DNA-binding transcriptional regulator AlpA